MTDDIFCIAPQNDPRKTSSKPVQSATYDHIGPDLRRGKKSKKIMSTKWEVLNIRTKYTLNAVA